MKRQLREIGIGDLRQIMQRTGDLRFVDEVKELEKQDPNFKYEDTLDGNGKLIKREEISKINNNLTRTSSYSYNKVDDEMEIVEKINLSCTNDRYTKTVIDGMSEYGSIKSWGVYREIDDQPICLNIYEEKLGENVISKEFQYNYDCNIDSKYTIKEEITDDDPHSNRVVRTNFYNEPDKIRKSIITDSVNDDYRLIEYDEYGIVKNEMKLL